MKSPDDVANASAGGGAGGGGPGGGGRWNVLVVDADPKLGELVRQQARQLGAATDASAKSPMGSSTGAAVVGVQINRVRVATTVEAAELEMRRSPAHILFVNVQLGDNAGLKVIRSFKRRWPRTQAIAVSRNRKNDLCLEAWRAGAVDMIQAPLHAQDIQSVLANLAVRKGEVDRLAQRNERLRVVCRRLNKARHEISQQVDLLCNDLVRAYQEMAQQLNLTQLASEFSDFVRGETEVEGILRRTMEWILRKLGPVNAAVYLPNGEEHFALGAYLNLDTQADAPLIDVLGRTIVEQARHDKIVALERDSAIVELFGAQAEALLGKSWFATGCHTRRECLAVLVVFKQQSGKDSGQNTTQGLIEAVAPVLAERIEQALGFYNRLHPFPDEGDSEAHSA